MAMSQYLIDVTRRRGRIQLRTARGPVLLALTSAIGLAASAQAVGQEYPAHKVGDWTVAAGKDKQGCFLTREYERAGKTTLLLGLDIDGANHLSVLNANWSIKPQDRLSLNFRLSTGGYSKHVAVGMASEGKQGFVTTFEAKFPAYFAASKLLQISRGDVPVEQLNLDGSGAGVAELRRCVWIHKAKLAAGARDMERPGQIPVDPFAPAQPRKSKD